MALKYALTAGLFVAALSIATASDAKLGGASTPAVSFIATGPAGLKIDGKGSALTVGENGDAVVVTVPLGGLKTGIELRDKHMKEKYLEVSKFPNAEIQVPRGSLKFPADGTQGSGSAQGTLKLHGKQKNVTFNYTAKKSGSKFDVTGEVKININDFGIEIPSYMGVTVKPDVAINVRFSAVDG